METAMTTSSSFSLYTPHAAFTANTFTAGEQMLPQVLGLSNGGFLVAYNNQDAGDGYILLDFYDADGNHLDVGVRTPHNSLPGATAVGIPSLAQLSDGNIVVVWADHDPNNFGLNKGIRYAIFTPEGAKIGSEKTLVSGTHVGPHVEALPQGGFEVSYSSGGHAHSVSYADFPYQYSPNVDLSNNTASETSSAVLANGGYVVAWRSSPGGGANTQLHARIYSNDGIPTTGEMTIDGVGDNSSPALVGLKNGLWAIAYQDTSWPSDNGSLGITLNILTPHGSPAFLGGPIHVNTGNSVSDSMPAITELDNGYILVSWSRSAGNNHYDVYGRIFTPTGEAISIDGNAGEFLIANAGDYPYPDVAALDSGRFVTAWAAQNGGAWDIGSKLNELARTTTGNNAHDTINGDALRDIISGGGGNDVINAGAGNDLVTAGAGNDTIDGGTGYDAAIYSGERLQYHVDQLANGDLRIVDLRAGSPDGSDTVRNVEHFVFSDGSVTATKLVTPPSVHWSASTDLGTHPAGWQPSLTGDFNGDGTSDALWFNPANNNLDIWSIQNGQWAGSSDAGSHPPGWQPAASGDFNGDGTDDILWLNPTNNHVDLWTMSNGHWSASSDVGSHPAGYAVAGAGDFNNDGTSDVLWYNAATGDTEAWMLANGQWSASVDIGAHPAGWQPAGVGDFNHDGTSDVLWFNPATNDAEVWLIQDGHWSASVNLGAHPAGYHVAAVGDFAHDGNSDVLWYNPTTGDTDVWKIANGHWAGSDNLGAHPGGWAPAGAGDFNHDGISDVLWGNAATNHLETWLLGNG
jgi:FG-GAP-like repeat/RTX calcium-binding nonapeptide repeat (4 copies)